ncbi:MAG: GTP cyclohydrolase 1 [Candidatus Sericytochromatia bacterium]|nr:MAG: GTP cyclohydrolase 1 [Candidatus Sericytochromatia bacterium]
MLDKTKTDKEMGLKVSNYLKLKGVETPLVPNYLSNSEKIMKIEKSFADIMNTLGLDLNDDSLKDTPKRIANMFINEIYWGLLPENFPKISVIENKIDYDSPVIEKNINIQSNCEHHFIVIDGKAIVSYIPKGKVIGLSKLNRIVEYFSKRPQLQERLTLQIFYALECILETSDIAVLINARHYCVRARGVEDVSSETITSKLGGIFKTDIALKNDFLSNAKTMII